MYYITLIKVILALINNMERKINTGLSLMDKDKRMYEVFHL